MGNYDWIQTKLCPGLGCVICNIMFLIQLQSVMEARKRKKLGTTSPYPYAILTVCQIGWTAYSYMLKDYFVFFSSALGVITGMLSCFTALHLLERPRHSKYEELERLWVENILLIGLGYWIVILFFATIVINSASSQGIQLVGASAACCSILYYGVPLVSMREIIRQRDASRLYLPTIIINLCNSGLWFIYGISLQLVSICLPNAIGLTLTMVQLVLHFMYPSPNQSRESKSSKEIDIEADGEDGVIDKQASSRYSKLPLSCVNPLHEEVKSIPVDIVSAIPAKGRSIRITTIAANTKNQQLVLG